MANADNFSLKKLQEYGTIVMDAAVESAKLGDFIADSFDEYVIQGYLNGLKLDDEEFGRLKKLLHYARSNLPFYHVKDKELLAKFVTKATRGY